MNVGYILDVHIHVIPTLTSVTCMCHIHPIIALDYFVKGGSI